MLVHAYRSRIRARLHGRRRLRLLWSNSPDSTGTGYPPPARTGRHGRAASGTTETGSTPAARPTSPSTCTFGGDPATSTLGKRHYRVKNYGLAEQLARPKAPARGGLVSLPPYDRLKRYDLADRACKSARDLRAAVRSHQQHRVLYLLRGDLRRRAKPSRRRPRFGQSHRRKQHCAGGRSRSPPQGRTSRIKAASRDKIVDLFSPQSPAALSPFTELRVSGLL